MQDNAPCHTAKFVKTFLSEEDVTVWSDQLKVQTRILNERTKENNPRKVKKKKNYGLIWKENGRKYPLMNTRH